MSGKGVDWLRLLAGYSIVVVWLGTILHSSLDPHYNVPATVNGLMMIVAGLLFGPTISGRYHKGGKKENDDSAGS